jgi:hypothetical protein
MPSSDHVGGIDRDQLSPELALVDPDLAHRARQRLTADWDQARRERERAPTTDETVASAQATPVVADDRPAAVAPPAPAPTRRAARSKQADAPVAPARRSGERGRRRGAALAMGAAALVAGGAAYLIASPSRIDRWLLSDEPVRSSQRSIDETGGRSIAVTTTQAAASARGTTTRSARTSSTPTSPAAVPTRQRQGQLQARAFGWAPVAHATHYLVDFYKGRTKIYAARRPRPNLTLPPQWTFRGRRRHLAPGKYGWRVRAVLPGRRAKVVVRAALQVRRAR